jgi:hypothetical protein
MTLEDNANARKPLPPPQVLALNVCDFIVVDPWTSKKTLIGLFSIIRAGQFPAFHPILSIHAALTNGRGVVILKLRIVDTEEVHPALLEMEQPIDFRDPRMVVDFYGSTERGIIFPSPGEYRVQLFADGELLSERRIILLDASEPQNE